MTLPRRVLVDSANAGVYHCLSRCVRRAFLCGDGCEHRKDWIRDRLEFLAGIFAIDVCGYAVMENHLHVILRTAPERGRNWSDRVVASRWLRLFPPPEELRAQRLNALLGEPGRLTTVRGRLADLSWFMRCLKEPIARRANREDGCTGRFWEGRFRSHALLDDAAVLSCSIYVDLNPIRAGIAETPERSDHTSIQERIRLRQRHRRRQHHQRRSGSRFRPLRHAEDDLWLAPISRRHHRHRGLLDLTLDQYLALVDAVGRMIRAGKSGSIPRGVRPILERLELDSQRWVTVIKGAGRLFGTAIGSPARLRAEAARRDCRWVVSALPVYASAR